VIDEVLARPEHEWYESDAAKKADAARKAAEQK
jgi:hypothetical protein